MVVGYVFGWLSESGGSGTLTAANNGLSVSGTTVQMGGPLIQDTSIDLAGFVLLFAVPGRIGVGVTGTPAASFEVAGNDINSIIVSTRYETSATTAAGFVARKANGTQASPSQILSGDYIGGMGAAGYTSSSAFGTTSGQAIFTAAENFTSSARGTNFIVQLAPIGSTTIATVFSISSAGVVAIPALTTNGLLTTSGSNGTVGAQSLASASLTITGAGTTTIDAGSKWFSNFHASSAATATTVAYSNILDGATVTIDYLKTTATDLAITFPGGTVISASSSCSISGVVATLTSTTNGRFTITILNVNSVYKVYIVQDVA